MKQTKTRIKTVSRSPDIDLRGRCRILHLNFEKIYNMPSLNSFRWY